MADPLGISGQIVKDDGTAVTLVLSEADAASIGIAGDDDVKWGEVLGNTVELTIGDRLFVMSKQVPER